MNQRSEWVSAAGTFAVVAIVISLVLCTGCAVRLSDDADVGFRFGTEVALFHNGPDDGSEAKLDLLEWMQDLISDGDKTDKTGVAADGEPDGYGSLPAEDDL